MHPGVVRSLSCGLANELNLHRPDFTALLDGEGTTNVNPTTTYGEQLASIRAIHPPARKALGALAIEIALL